MEIFIRLDIVGHWRGKEHKSSFQGWGDEVESFQEMGADIYFEDGISCYMLDPDGMAELYNYWMNIASMDEDDANRMQVTVFGGEFNGFGSDNEYVASCERTIAEFPSILLFEKWKELEKRWFDDDDTEAKDTKDYINENAKELIEFIESFIE